MDAILGQVVVCSRPRFYFRFPFPPPSPYQPPLFLWIPARILWLIGCSPLGCCGSRAPLGSCLFSWVWVAGLPKPPFMLQLWIPAWYSLTVFFCFVLLCIRHSFSPLTNFRHASKSVWLCPRMCYMFFCYGSFVFWMFLFSGFLDFISLRHPQLEQRKAN